MHKQRSHTSKPLTPQEAADRLFIGIFPGGISYCDRKIEEHGDYKQVAFLPYDTLELQVRKGCHPALLQLISADAESIQAKRGQEFRVSTCGQTVTLGYTPRRYI